MGSKMSKSKVGHNMSPIWLDYLSHIINNLGQPSTLCCPPSPFTTERTKSILRKAISQINIARYLNKHWGNAVCRGG